MSDKLHERGAESEASMDARIKRLAQRAGAQARPVSVRFDPAVIRTDLGPRRRVGLYQRKAHDDEPDGSPS